MIHCWVEMGKNIKLVTDCVQRIEKIHSAMRVNKPTHSRIQLHGQSHYRTLLQVILSSLQPTNRDLVTQWLMGKATFIYFLTYDQSRTSHLVLSRKVLQGTTLREILGEGTLIPLLWMWYLLHSIAKHSAYMAQFLDRFFMMDTIFSDKLVKSRIEM